MDPTIRPEPTLFAQDQSEVKAERIVLEKQILFFRATLSDEDRSSFDSGRRLAPATRDKLLSSMTPTQLADSGLRFSTASTSPTPPGWEESLRKRELFNVQAILMDLWDYADVLWLDFTIDVALHGQMLGFSGDRAALPRNHTTTWSSELREAFKAQQEQEIERGRVVGPFPNLPFPNRPLLPIVTAYKSDGTPRFCLDFSRVMINRGCDKFYIGPQDFNDAVEAMIKAGPDGYGAEWDIADAFKALYFHVSCVDLTQFHIPGLGYAYQASGIFVAAIMHLWLQVAHLRRAFAQHPVSRYVLSVQI